MPQFDALIMIPGPTHIPARILLAMAKPMIGHRTNEYADIQRECTEGLQKVFKTKSDVFIFTASGTGGMEAAVVNTLSPGDKALALDCGKFGERFGDIARVFGADVDAIVYERGMPADPSDVEKKLTADPAIKAVLVTLNETSTGVVNPLQEIARIAKERGALVLVDAISGMGAMPCDTDAWGLDVVVAGSQKAFMLPPGFAFVSISEAAWRAAKASKMPKYYWDFAEMRKAAEKLQTAYTPNVSMMFALHESLRMILEEGVDEAVARHARMADATRAAVEALGLELLAKKGFRSNSVTAVRMGDFDPDAMRKIMQNKYGVLLSGGQEELKGKIFRIGHMGYVFPREILTTISCLESALAEMGHAFEPGAGVKAAQATFAA